MCRSCIVWLCVVIGMLCCGVRLAAQDVEYDYRIYKYYDEPQDAELWLRGVAQDSVVRDVDMMLFRQPATSARYALTALGYMPRGVGREGESYGVGILGVEYDASRMLSSLGVGRTSLDGMAGVALLGGVVGTQVFDLSSRWDGHYVRGELSTRNYNIGVSHRATYSLPTKGVLLDDGWRLSHYARFRTGRDATVEGVFSSSADVAFEASYRNRRHEFAVVAMLPWSERGLRESSVMETYMLTNNIFYNPSWGMQDGSVRNSRVAMSLHPEVVSQWSYRLTALTRLELSVDVGFKRSGVTALTWFDAPTPMPDNYRYLPSYFTDDVESRAVAEAWTHNDLSYTQVDWDDLYHTNEIQSDGHARYAVEERCHNVAHGTLTAGLRSSIGPVEVSYGVAVSMASDRSFKVMDDLLGADHIVDIDYYLRDDATYSNSMQNNLHTPNRIVECGDRFGYDYSLTRSMAALYGLLQWRGEAMALSVGAQVAAEYTWRCGYFEKELFKGNGSYGRSRSVVSSPYRLGVAWHYGVGRHALGLSVLLRGDSPEAEDMFLQTQYNNRRTGRFMPSTTLAAELAYRFEHERITATATLYAVSYNNYVDVLHYYDDLAGLYTDAVASNIDRLHCGLEATATVSWSRYLRSMFALNLGRYCYMDDVLLESYDDSNNDSIAVSSAAMRGYSTGSPQVTAYGDVTFAMSGWQVCISAQCRAYAYLSPSFVRRTDRVVSYAPSVEEADVLRHQERIKDSATLNIYVAKRIRLGDGMGLRLQLSAYNLLGGGVVYSGYEQNRVRRVMIQGRTHVEPFAGKMMYGAMRSLQLSASLWF